MIFGVVDRRPTTEDRPLLGDCSVRRLAQRAAVGEIVLSRPTRSPGIVKLGTPLFYDR